MILAQWVESSLRIQVKENHVRNMVSLLRYAFLSLLSFCNYGELTICLRDFKNLEDVCYIRVLLLGHYGFWPFLW